VALKGMPYIIRQNGRSIAADVHLPHKANHELGYTLFDVYSTLRQSLHKRASPPSFSSLTTMPDIPFTVFSGIGVLICIPPAYFNWKIPCRPWATLILIFWVFILNLLFFMDSIIWSSTDLNTWWDGKIYCDIDARLKDMFEIGVGGAAIGICRFLADATDPNPSRTDLRQGRFKRNMIDFFIGIILPMILQGLKFLVEVARYRIIGVNGCQAVVAHAWPSLLVYHLWVPGLVLVATGYACMLPPLAITDFRPLSLQLVGHPSTSRGHLGSSIGQWNFQSRIPSTYRHLPLSPCRVPATFDYRSV